MNEIGRKAAHTVTELASVRQNQVNWPIIMERAVEGIGAGSFWLGLSPRALVCAWT